MHHASMLTTACCTIERMLAAGDMAAFKKGVATLTGGSGAVAVVLTERRMSSRGHRLLGGAIHNASAHHELCRWGPDTGIPASGRHVMETDSVGVLQHGVALGLVTYKAFKATLGWTGGQTGQNRLSPGGRRPPADHP